MKKFLSQKLFVFLISIIFYSFLVNGGDACTNNIVIDSDIFGGYGTGWNIFYGGTNAALRWGYDSSYGRCSILTYDAFADSSNNWISSLVCTPTITVSTVNANFDISGSKLLIYNYLISKGHSSILQNNLYMNTKIEYVLYKDGSQVAVSSSINKLVPPGGTTYSLANPFTQSNVETTYGAGSYVVKARATPIDGKCPSSISAESIAISSFTILPAAAPPLTGTLSASTSISIISGTTFTLTWSASNANSCKINADGTTMFSALAATGTTAPISQSLGLKTYNLVCSNAVLSDVQVASITMEVTAPVCTWSEWTPSSSSQCSGTLFLQSRTYSCGGSESTTGYGTAYCCVPDSTYTYSCSGNYLQTYNSCGSYAGQELCSAGCSGNACNPDLDGDHFADIDTNSDGKIDDWCPLPSGTTLTGNEYRFNGCPTEYSIDTVQGGCPNPSRVNFDGTNLQCNFHDCNFWCNNGNYFSLFTDGNAISPVNDNYVLYKPTQGTNQYICLNKESGDTDLWVGSCNLRFNGDVSNYCNLNIAGHNELLRKGDSKKLYKYKKILKNIEENRLEFNGRLNVTCDITGNTLVNGITSLTGTPLPIDFRYSSPKILSGPEYDNLIRDPLSGELKVNDTITVGKLSCDTTTDACQLNTINGNIQINLTEIPQLRTAEIKIIKDGYNIRNDTIDITSIALQAHKIQKFTNTTDATNFIAKSYDVMTKFEITKNLTYNSVTNKTQVKIMMNNIDPADRVNLTLYMLVDKTIANSLDDILNINQGNGQFFVVDKDPIIGWYFNESSGDEEVGYEVPGDSEGGTVIITQTPILYNEGELIINYRETACSSGELELFELDNLISSNVYNPGSAKLYKVCITHLDSSINLVLGAGINSINVMSYTNNENASSNPDELTTKITLSVPNADLYWDVKVQKENPNGNYSCIGSFNIINQSSLFGDCGYNQDTRIWIHLGSDMNAPTTTLSYPGLAHTLRVTLTAFEPTWESGFKSLSYRIVEDSESFTSVLTSSVSFMVTCPNDWNCKKTIEFYAEDIEGNIEIIKSKDLLLIDKGSACQSDCTAKPSPNRYLKECSNLNSCSFYQFNNLSINDGGNYVANICDYLVIGSWAKYNETSEILCPSGPFRESKFTTERLNLIDESDCENVIKTAYPILYDGENIIMNIVSCINYEE